jgi:hypothetical protein
MASSSPSQVPEVLLHTPSFDGSNGRRRCPAGPFARQGVKASTNAQGRFECRACPAVYGKIPDFPSTKERRKHERNFHEQPSGGRTDFKRVSDKMETAGLKRKEDKIRKLHQAIGKAHQATARQLEEAGKLLREFDESTYRSSTLM